MLVINHTKSGIELNDIVGKENCINMLYYTYSSGGYSFRRDNMEPDFYERLYEIALSLPYLIIHECEAINKYSLDFFYGDNCISHERLDDDALFYKLGEYSDSKFMILGDIVNHQIYGTSFDLYNIEDFHLSNQLNVLLRKRFIDKLLIDL